MKTWCRNLTMLWHDQNVASVSDLYLVRTRLLGKRDDVHIMFLEYIDRLLKLEKKALDGSQSFSGARLSHFDGTSVLGLLI